MTDLANLGIRVEGQEVVTADKQLDGLTASAGRAETATEKLAAAARGNGAAMMTMHTALRQQNRALDAVRGATGLTSHETLNLGRQFADVGVSLASGQALWMVAIQQGAQIGEVFAEARNRGVGFTAVLTGIVNMLRPVIAMLSPAALAVGALGAAFGLAARDINKGNDDVLAGLNLTEKQIEKLKESGESMGVTMGDVFNGVGTTIKEVLSEAFGPQIDQAKSAWSGFMDDLGSNTMNELRAIAGFFGGTYEAVKATWSMLPAAIGDAAYSAARAVIGALQILIDRSVGAINSLRDRYNALPAWMRGGQTAPTAVAANLSIPDNPYAGAMTRTGVAAQAAYNRGDAGARQWVNDTADRTRGNIEDSRDARLISAAGDAAEETAGKTRKAAEEIQRLQKVGDASLRPLRGAFLDIVDPLKLIADEMRLIDGLAQDMAADLASAFGESGRALGELLTTMSGYQARMADINLAEREHRLTAMQAERERATASVSHYGDMLSAAKGFFEEGSDGYKALQAAEQAYRIFQFVSTVQAMMLGGQETAFTVAQNAVRATSHGVVAVARAIASLPFPLNIAAGAATIAALAAIGVKLMGGGGGGGARSIAAEAPETEATNRIRSSAAMGQSRAGAANSTTTIRVVPHDDRFDAYVDSRAQPAATAAYRASVTTSRGVIPAEQTRRDRFKLGEKSAYGR